jgi:hypothetical protein
MSDEKGLEIERDKRRTVIGITTITGVDSNKNLIIHKNKSKYDKLRLLGDVETASPITYDFSSKTQMRKIGDYKVSSDPILVLESEDTVELLCRYDILLRHWDGTPYRMFYGSTFKSIKIDDVESDELESISYMFEHCNSEEIEVNFIDKSSNENLTSIDGMFQTCRNLRSIKITGLDLSNVDSAKNLFEDCGQLSKIHIENFTSKKLFDIQGMFAYCTNLRAVDLTSIDILENARVWNMFNGCYNLSKVKLPKSIYDKLGKDRELMYKNIDFQVI